MGDIELVTSRWPLSFDNRGFLNLMHFIEDQTIKLIKRKGEFKRFNDLQWNALMRWFFSHISPMEGAFYRFEKIDPEFADRMYTCFELLKNNMDNAEIKHLIR